MRLIKQPGKVTLWRELHDKVVSVAQVTAKDGEEAVEGLNRWIRINDPFQRSWPTREIGY